MSKWEVQLLRRWELVCDGTPVPIGGFARRLVAGVTLAGPASLEAIAELLLPGRVPEDSLERLETEVSRVKRGMPGLLDDGHERLALAPEVWVDLTELLRAADCPTALVYAAPELIGELRDAELLPGWAEGWTLYYRELVRLFRLATLEAISRYSLLLDDAATAAVAARSSAAIEPLRESSHALLIRALVLAGNLEEAFFVHEDFRHRFLKQTGAEPSPALTGALGLTPEAAGEGGRRRPLTAAAHPSGATTQGGS
ncbi:MAG TPA: bacterial transcriptional activator domain-containing protein [Sinomonas sp.]|nr:bacterial transcriptional activator domain-containing protein [Sinomonas sp.]